MKIAQKMLKMLLQIMDLYANQKQEWKNPSILRILRWEACWSKIIIPMAVEAPTADSAPTESSAPTDNIHTV